MKINIINEQGQEFKIMKIEVGTAGMKLGPELPSGPGPQPKHGAGPGLRSEFKHGPLSR